MDSTDSRLRAEKIDLEIDDLKTTQVSQQPQKLKLYHVSNLPQKIQLWLIVFLSLGSLISNLTSIFSSVGLIPSINTTCNCPK